MCSKKKMMKYYNDFITNPNETTYNKLIYKLKKYDKSNKILKQSYNETLEYSEKCKKCGKGTYPHKGCKCYLWK